MLFAHLPVPVTKDQIKHRVAVIGSGPTALYFLKHIIQTRPPEGSTALTFFESSRRLGPGMPYDPQWVGTETLANIACEEVPDLDLSPHEWFSTQPDSWFKERNLSRDVIDKHFIPKRHLLGDYFEAQFQTLISRANQAGIETHVIPETTVTDIIQTSKDQMYVEFVTKEDAPEIAPFDTVVITTGHHWPTEQKESQTFYASPWPIGKLHDRTVSKVGLIGTSLSSVDVCLDLARRNGQFSRSFDGVLRYIPSDPVRTLRVFMHSRRGLLPVMRPYFESPRFEMHQYVTEAQIHENIEQNSYLSLDFIFEDVIKKAIASKSPELYAEIEEMDLEEFIGFFHDTWTRTDQFDRLKSEYLFSYASIANKEPVFWREIFDDVSYTVNFYTKYMSGEDIIRVCNLFMPFVSYLVAVLPQQTSECILAMHEANALHIVATGGELTVSHSEHDATISFRDSIDGTLKSLSYDLIVDCTGQKPSRFEDFPFSGLASGGIVTPSFSTIGDKATVTRIVEHGGVKVDNCFHPISVSQKVVRSVFILSAPMLGRVYPYHSGLPFCNEIAQKAAEDLKASISGTSQIHPTAH
jgi:uncharacterized NAD(P)/FAD-binding protein YdhS